MRDSPPILGDASQSLVGPPAVAADAPAGLWGVVGSAAHRRPRSQFVLLAVYLAVLAVAELLLVFANQSGDGTFALYGLLLDVILVVSLPLAASRFAVKDEPFAAFLGTLMLPPLIRAVTLSTPLILFTQTEWLAVVSVPLLLAAASMMRALHLRPRDVFLALGKRRYLAVNITFAAAGLGFGLAEFRILHPQPWIDASGSGRFVLGAVGIFLSTGLAEELIYRGLLLRTGTRFLGTAGGLVYVTVVFTILHAGFLSLADLGLVFAFGLSAGIVVLFTRSLWGAVAAHTVANVLLYMVLPFGL